MRTRGIRHETSFYVFNFFAFVITGILALLCLLPFIIIISGSFTSNMSILKDGYSLFPKEFSTEAYATLFRYPETLLRAYGVTIGVTAIGTALGLLLISMTGYVLSRKDFVWRNKISFFIYFTSIFGGGVVPWYMMYTNVLHLKDSYLALILPSLMSPFLIILMRTFISSSVPDAVIESAKIDGAGDWRIYRSIVMPIAGPALATIGLFLALGYWNDWYLSSMFITSPEKYQLQFYLYNMVNSAESMAQLDANNPNITVQNLPTESVKMAMAVVATGPVFLFYPFVQKYFVSGITVGAVKG
ncbi:carbohydrate ABC transporter permease [uncultured Ruthenibacterium sp.]|uniref:carbohydrate ABC transporter permease n=1 Tax=uncultured Ruthenibacterium sp. TaxID=1905347 RepID=UPI00349E6469